MSSPAPFSWTTRVYYEDTDASGVVYHARYLQFFERARTEWLRDLGVQQGNLREQDAVVFTVANLEIDFLRPARLDDELVVTVAVEQQRRASLWFGQTLALRAAPEAHLARARVRVGCVGAADFRPRPLPAFLNPTVSGVPA